MKSLINQIDLDSVTDVSFVEDGKKCRITRNENQYTIWVNGEERVRFNKTESGIVPEKVRGQNYTRDEWDCFEECMGDCGTSGCAQACGKKCGIT